MAHPFQPNADHDAALCRRAKAGDSEALDALVGRYDDRVRRWAAYEARDPQLAPEVGQEAWIRFTRTLDRLDPDRPLAGWLRTIVRNCARDLERTERRHLRTPPLAARVPESLERRVDLKRGAARMVAAFRELSPRQQQALDLVDRQGMSAPEAAAVMDIDPGSVRALLHQGRRALRAHLIAPGLRALLREP